MRLQIFNQAQPCLFFFLLQRSSTIPNKRYIINEGNTSLKMMEDQIFVLTFIEDQNIDFRKKRN